MALSGTEIAWECRADADSVQNGGGFVVGASGTDFSQQASAQHTYTDLVISAGDMKQLTSVARGFTSVDVGNIIRVTGGTGFTQGRYYIVSVSLGVATMDRNVGTLGST